MALSVEGMSVLEHFPLDTTAFLSFRSKLSSTIVTTVTSDDFNQFDLRSGAHHLPFLGMFGSGIKVGMTP